MSRALVACVVLFATVARAAEPSFEALGQAPIASGDRVRARERALDDALRQAVEQAVATLLDPQIVSERASQLKLNVYPKARSYIATYRVLEEGEQGGLFQIRVDAQVATARLARDVQAPQAVKPSAPPKPRVIVCFAERVASASPTASPLERRLADAVAARNLVPMALEEPNAQPPLCAPSSPGDKLDDDALAALAQKRGAQGALVGIAHVEPQGTVHGTKLLLAHARVMLSLIGPDFRRAAQAEADGDAYGNDLPTVAQDATSRAIDSALRMIGPALGAQWPTAATSGGVLVHLAATRQFADYRELVRVLTQIPGVADVTPRRFYKGGTDLLARTAVSAPALSRALQSTSASSDATIHFTAEPLGDLELKVSAAPAAP